MTLLTFVTFILVFGTGKLVLHAHYGNKVHDISKKLETAERLHREVTAK